MNGVRDAGAVAVDAALLAQEHAVAYVPPRLTRLGDIRELTLGGSPGIGDSGGATTFRCPGCP